MRNPPPPTRGGRPPGAPPPTTPFWAAPKPGGATTRRCSCATKRSAHDAESRDCRPTSPKPRSPARANFRPDCVSSPKAKPNAMCFLRTK